MFFVVVLTVWALVHLYLWARLVKPVRSTRGKRWATGVLLASAFPAPALFLLDRTAPIDSAFDVLRWFAYVEMGLVFLVFFLTVARDLLWLLAWIVDRATRAATKGERGVLPADPDRRAFLGNAVNLGVVGVASGFTTLGFVEARRTPDVLEVDVPIAGLPAALDGFRIVHLTDIHVGPTIRRGWIRDIVDVANGLRPDLIAITGDMVDGDTVELADHVAPLADLRSRHGTFFVTGNHEYYSGAEEWKVKNGELGMTVLENEHRILDHGGAQLLVAGVPDPSSGDSHPERALHGAPPAVATKILLAHQPKSIRDAARAGFDLQLSGHTHGGQIVPWNFLVPLAQPFTAGLHKLQRTWCYVSRGTGYWGPPLRLGAPSEIAVVTLRRA